jgi:hypothetical protein
MKVAYSAPATAARPALINTPVILTVITFFPMELAATSSTPTAKSVLPKALLVICLIIKKQIIKSINASTRKA